jgi:hypothetical protein
MNIIKDLLKHNHLYLGAPEHKPISSKHTFPGFLTLVGFVPRVLPSYPYAKIFLILKDLVCPSNPEWPT